MRLTGVINKGKTAGPDVAPHVQAKLDATNSLAKRHVDKIDLAQRKPANIRGKGAYKQWTTEACLRTAWGRPLDLAREDTGGMFRGAVSSRVVADWFEASHAHVRKVRCAIAYGVVFYQRMFLLSLPMVAHLIWMASCDESEINLTPPSSGSSTKCNVLMMHFIVAARTALDSELCRKQIVAAPGILRNNTALAVYEGLTRRAPVPFLGLARKARRAMLCLNTDSANTCKALGAHMAGIITKVREAPGSQHTRLYFMQQFCLMHQVSLAFEHLVGVAFLYQSDVLRSFSPQPGYAHVSNEGQAR